MNTKTQIAGLALLGMAAALPATMAHADPTLYLERAGISALGDKVRLTRIPVKTTDAQGHYIDIDLTFKMDDQGQLITTTAVSTSIPANTTEFISGKYDSGRLGTCEVGVSPAKGGRVGGSISCNSNLSATWVSGPIIGNPYQPKLVAAKVDAIPGADNISWGVGMGKEGAYAIPVAFQGSWLVSAQQSGNVLALTSYDNKGEVRGTWTFALTK